MVQIKTLAVAILSLALPAIAQQLENCEVLSDTMFAESNTGFRFETTGASTWRWYSRDRNTDLIINEKCEVKQNRPGSQLALETFCVQTSDTYTCYEAPGQREPSGTCKLPICDNIKNVWGWYD
jgi:hypothetical protein